MIWKAIGSSVIGTAHVAGGKPCEDAIQYCVLPDANGDETLICCVSDGAGSAHYAAWASDFATREMTERLRSWVATGEEMTEGDIYAIAEQIYDGLEAEAELQGMPRYEFSCTLLGCLVTSGRSIFFQIGDGAIVRNDGSCFYIPVWWPDNGEYQNTTFFITDDRSLSNFKVLILDEEADEIAMFSDGLQNLALNTESVTAHQPFFSDLFRFLRLADDEEKVNVLNGKLAEYLDGKQINDRTSDDKTLFLASRIPA